MYEVNRPAPVPPADVVFGRLCRLSLRYPFRLALLVPLALTGCRTESSRTVARGGPGADSAFAILSRVTPAMTADAFERLHAVPFTAEVVSRSGDEVESRRQLRNERLANGSMRLRVLSGGEATTGRLDDPVSTLLPGTPPYLAPRTRDRYRVRLMHATSPAGQPLVGAEARLDDHADDEAVRRVRAWTDAATGEPYAIEVVRQASSAIFDEAGRAGVRFRPASGGVLPAAAAGRSRIDVPFGPPRTAEVDILIREDPR